jgi:transposase InsO family protein
MEKRSYRRIRDLDVPTASQGLVANEIGCVRISMMAREAKRSLQRAEYRCARPITSRSSYPACTARPVHTKYMVKRDDPSGQSWSTFLRNHAPHSAAMDLFVVPSIGFVQLYVLVIVRLARRELAWLNITRQPTAEWIAQQITEAFPWNEAPRYLIRDQDGIYGMTVRRRLRAMGIRDKPIAPGSPWQNGYAERLIGTIRRVDHLIVLGEAHLRRIIHQYAAFYNGVRTHRALGQDSPVHRAVQRIGAITSRPVLGGLHHHYCRI